MEKDVDRNVQLMLETSYNVDGLFCANDVIAIGAIKYLKQLGKKIPEEIAIVGFSNETISSVIEPALTTIHQSGSEIGIAAANLLMEKMSDNNIHKTITIETDLIVRKSSLKAIK